MIFDRQAADANLAKLPEVAAARHPTDRTPILIRRGLQGFFAAPWPGFDPDDFNRRYGVTPAQREAMLCGSLFGWHVPGADTARHADAEDEAP